jgi:hypothetical protein
VLENKGTMTTAMTIDSANRLRFGAGLVLRRARTQAMDFVTETVADLATIRIHLQGEGRFAAAVIDTSDTTPGKTGHHLVAMHVLGAMVVATKGRATELNAPREGSGRWLRTVGAMYAGLQATRSEDTPTLDPTAVGHGALLTRIRLSCESGLSW